MECRPFFSPLLFAFFSSLGPTPALLSHFLRSLLLPPLFPLSCQLTSPPPSLLPSILSIYSRSCYKLRIYISIFLFLSLVVAH